MLTRDKLLKIKELKLHGRLEKMDDNLLNEYCRILDVFIQRYPSQEEEMKNAFSAKDYKTLSEGLMNVSRMLVSIYADDLAQNCTKFSGEAQTSKHDVIEMFLAYLLTRISMLSIDIQMAKNDSDASEKSDEEVPTEPVDVAELEPAPKNILAVDDVSLTLNGLKLILQNTEYKLTCVSSGDMALRYLTNHTPDLFILDIEMPLMNGYELAKRIREKGFRAPIIFLTGNATQDYLLKAIQAGAADFIVKPVNKDFVLEKIKKHIG